MSLVRLSDVEKSFGDVKAVDGVSFSIDRGEVVGFLGPNGAGKTTAMRLITQYLEPDSGTIEIDGRRIQEIPIEARRRIGYLPETNPLYTEMLVSEYLDYIGRLRGLGVEERDRRIGAAVGQTGIEEVYHRPIGQLSKGYRQRVGLAQAILPEPDILILDEPTEGLDPNQRVEIRRLITELGRDRTVLLSSHVMQEVQRTCSRLLIIDRGKIVADGTVDSLLTGGAQGMRVTVELEADAAAAASALAALETVSSVQPASDGGVRTRLTLTATPAADPRPEVFALASERGWTLWELHLERESLEELFHELTGPGA
ncbi:MAG: ATP-binding cassette domain-containing protein [Gemmatimonadota bacterium]